MTLETLHRMLAWSILINFVFLLVWFIGFIAFHQLIFDIHAVWFRITPEQFDAMHYQGMAMYKIGIILFFLSPYIALQIIRPKHSEEKKEAV